MQYDVLTVTVHNDFHNDNGIFPLFDGLEVKESEIPFHSKSNGATNGEVHVNGNSKQVNGH